MTEKKFYVYTYSYLDGTPFYVGKGTGARKRVHLRDAKAGRNNKKWAVRVIAKMLREGSEPIISVVKDDLTTEEAVQLEIELIKQYGRKDIGTGILVNCTDGGDGAINVSDETKKKQTVKLIEWVKTKRIVDDEYRRKISETMTGRKLPEKHKEKLRQYYSIYGHPMKGKKQTVQARANMVEGQKRNSVRRPHSEFTKQKLSAKRKGKLNPFFGRKHSLETLEKIASWGRGRPGHWIGKKFSEEHLAKLRIWRICPHCGKEGGGSAMNRYHMDRCKSRTILAEAA
jgi:hypothetical protein